MNETTRKDRTRSRTRTTATSQATAGETLVLSIVFSIALTCVAIGAWSLLAFLRSLSLYGASGLLSGLLKAITG